MLSCQELINKIKEYNPSCDENLVKKAYLFAKEAHGGQKRHSGESYFSHPVAVAEILCDLKLDDYAIISALLHDVLEDTEIEFSEINEIFGIEISYLVDGLTKFEKFDEMRSTTSGSFDIASENLRKLVMALSWDIRVLLIKLADRLHNMRTISYLPSAEKKFKKAAESLEIYAPLAGRIGLSKLKEEIEDLAFAIIEPESYAYITSKLNEISENSENLISEIIADLKRIFVEEGLSCEINGRKKSPYSIWLKMKRKNVGFHNLRDVMAFRCIVENQKACYQALGVINSHLKMVPGSFKDYISIPKDNGYKSIHLTSIGPSGGKIEIQIRDKIMHEIANFGVAAQWLYKEKGKDYSPNDNKESTGREFDGIEQSRSNAKNESEFNYSDQQNQPQTTFALHGSRQNSAQNLALSSILKKPKYQWIDELMSIFENAKTAGEIVKASNLNLAAKQVFCFSPMGDIINLAIGSSVIDFAYAIHSEIGNHCYGSRVNGIISPLSHIIENGDQIEIITNNLSKPSLEWLRFANSSRAKSAIRAFIRNEKFNEYKNLGKAILQKFFHSHGYEFSEDLLQKTLSYFNKKSLDDLFCKVAEGNIGRQEVLKECYPQFCDAKSEKSFLEFGTSSIKSEVEIESSLPGIAINFAICCNPIFGDPIIGVINVGRGIIAHHQLCSNLQNLAIPQGKIVDLKWREISPYQIQPRNAKIRVVVANKSGALASITSVIANRKININDIRTVKICKETFEVLIDVAVLDITELQQLLAAIRISNHIIYVERFLGVYLIKFDPRSNLASS